MLGTKDGLAGPAPAQNPPYVPPARVERLLAGGCTTVNTPDELPNHVKSAFASITHDKAFVLADPTAQLNTKGGVEHSLPERRLLPAGRCGNNWFVEYERSGRTMTTALVVFRIKPDRSVAFVWGSQLKSGGRDIRQLRAMLADGSFLDAPDFW